MTEPENIVPFRRGPGRPRKPRPDAPVAKCAWWGCSEDAAGKLPVGRRQKWLCWEHIKFLRPPPP